MTTSRKLYQKLQKQYSKRINLDLKRIKKVLSILRNPQDDLNNVINVIGSDGKNSFLTSLKYFLEADNKKVNTFTSPHLYDVRSRIWLGNRFISLTEIKKYKRIVEKTKQRLTLFELLTCIFILAANKTDADSFNLVEAGLFFRKDSTNLWRSPLAQICTQINKQHTEWISPKSIGEICKQKVGFLSENTNIYTGKQRPRTLKIIKKILKKNSSHKEYYGSWSIISKKNKKFYKDQNNLILLKSQNIHSDGLWENVGLAIKVAIDLGVDAKKITRAIKKIKFEGRCEFIKGKLTKKLYKNERFLIDTCHSEESTKNLARYLRKFKLPIYGICGILKNKNPKKLMKNFKGIFKKLITFKIPEESNALSSYDLKKIAESEGFKTVEAENIKDALEIVSSKERKIIVLWGSTYGAGNALSLN
ncbi:MAG: hypothetical protein CBD56_03130 [Candidatus Pelagibacter sp. TMED196]|nr:MAG: hypothetical protein CBD56_03130 [Candidatus Pelagibacter sp. TMED196]